MKKLNLLFLLAFSGYVSGQSCDGYFPVKQGALMELTSYNDKDKPQTITTSTVLGVDKNGNDIVLNMHSEITNEKNKPLSKVDYKARCNNGSFYIETKSLVSAEQLKGFENMDVKMDAEDIAYPVDCSPGQSLPDARLKIGVSMGSMKLPGTSIEITNRKVEGKETITTPAGTFECIKVTATEKVKNIVENEMQIVEWISKGNGVIRSESYKGGKLKSYTLMTRLSK